MQIDINIRKNKLQAQFNLLWAIRSFFQEKNFLDVLTPPMVKNPGMETHIHPFKLDMPNHKVWIHGICRLRQNFT
jgi:lysyl-tRNA synthetase class 2